MNDDDAFTADERRDAQRLVGSHRGHGENHQYQTGKGSSHHHAHVSVPNRDRHRRTPERETFIAPRKAYVAGVAADALKPADVPADAAASQCRRFVFRFRVSKQAPRPHVPDAPHWTRRECASLDSLGF